MLDFSVEDALISDFVDQIMDYLCDPALQEDLCEQICEICHIDAVNVYTSGRFFLDLACAKMVIENHMLVSNDYSVAKAGLKEDDRKMLVEYSCRLFSVLALELANNPQTPPNLRRYLSSVDRFEIENTIRLFSERLDSHGAPQLCSLVLERLTQEIRISKTLDREFGLYVSIVLVGTPFSRFWADAVGRLTGDKSMQHSLDALLSS